MQLDRLREFALSLPHTNSSVQWGGVAFKVEGKVFHAPAAVTVDGRKAEQRPFRPSVSPMLCAAYSLTYPPGRGTRPILKPADGKLCAVHA
jgi:hypothetical protein